MIGGPLLDAFASGYASTFIASAVAMVLASIVAATLIRGTKSELLPRETRPQNHGTEKQHGDDDSAADQ